MIRIRAVGSHTLGSELIDIYEHAFWASHVEAVFPDGYIGARAEGGVQLRPVGYDKSDMSKERFYDIPATPVQETAWENYLRKMIGTPYDLEAILGFVVESDLHEQGHVICSALMAFALTACGRVKSWPIPASEITPRDIVLVAYTLAGI